MSGPPSAGRRNDLVPVLFLHPLVTTSSRAIVFRLTLARATSFAAALLLASAAADPCFAQTRPDPTQLPAATTSQVPLTAAYNALETERVPMDNLGRKTQLVPFEFARLDELIQKNSAVALRITESRNESANGRLLVNRDLDKFTLALERVHSRIIIDGGSHCLGRGSEQDRK